MSDNNGCFPGVILLVLAILIGSVLVGGPVLSSTGLSWDNSAAINREAQRTERTRIEAARDVRIAEERGETTRQFAVMLAIVGGVVAVAWATTRSIQAVAARPHRPVVVPPQIIMVAQPILDAELSARLEWVDERDFQGWAIINPRTQERLLIEDKQARR